MFQGYRSDDAVITICQDNARRTIDIRDINPQAEEALGYAAANVSGKPLADFLPARIQALLSEYVEFEDEGNDVGSVLSKVQSFCIVDSRGKEAAFRLKVLRGESPDRNAYFHLILQTSPVNRRNEAFRAILREHFKGHEVLDAATGLPDRASILKDVELVAYYVNKDALKAHVAVVEPDGFEAFEERHGEEGTGRLLKHLASIARQNLRADDMIGRIAPHQLAIILLDTTPESARMVLNRLRWLMAAAPLEMQGREPEAVTVSIAFARIGAGRDVLTHTEVYLDSLPKNGNSLAEVVEE